MVFGRRTDAALLWRFISEVDVLERPLDLPVDQWLEA